jgi:hypothetical protein
MEDYSHLPADRPCPIGFIVTPAFVCALVWLYAVLSQATP